MMMSRHAQIRNKQRGFTKRKIEYILQNGDENKRPGNAVEVVVENKLASQLIGNLKKEISLIEHIKNKAILLSCDNGTIITMYSKF
jgi:hypothetical protein